jgi:hypothetical protein
LDSESPFWRLDTVLNPSDQSFANALTGSAQTGILVSDLIDNYLIPLPDPQRSDSFWGENRGPSVFQDSESTYVRHPDFSLIPSIKADITVVSEGTFIVSGTVSGDALWFRRCPVDVYPYYGTWQEAISYDVSRATIGIPQTFPGDSVDIVYRSSQNIGILSSGSVLLKTDARYGSVQGVLTGPLLPADLGLPFAPSREFLNLFSSSIVGCQVGESHLTRLLRLQTVLSLLPKLGRDRAEYVSWTLAACLGRVTASTTTSLSTAVTGQILYPELPDRISLSASFTLPPSGFSGTICVSGNLLTDSPLEQRESIGYIGGQSRRTQPLSAFSPFKTAGDPPSDSPLAKVIPSDVYLKPGFSTFAYAVQSTDTDVTVNTAIRGKRVQSGISMIRPGFDTSPLRILSRSDLLKVINPMDAVTSGDLDLRSPGGVMPTPSLLPIISINTPTWSSGTTNPAPRGIPLDLDSAGLYDPSTNIQYGSLGGTPSRYDDPIAPRYL